NLHFYSVINLQFYTVLDILHAVPLFFDMETYNKTPVYLVSTPLAKANDFKRDTKYTGVL
ncbi:MAG: hypothetical protein ACTIH5_11405, partial [Lactococcus cremoris]